MTQKSYRLPLILVAVCQTFSLYADDCHKFFQNPTDPLRFLSADQKTLFSIEELSSSKNNQKLQVQSWDLEKNQLQVFMRWTTSAPRPMALVSNIDPKNGLNLIQFDRPPLCQVGLAKSYFVPNKKRAQKGLIQNLPASLYGYLEGLNYRYLYDAKDRQIKELDPLTQQVRPGLTLPSEGAPLFYDELNRHVYALKLGKESEFQRYSAFKPKTPQASIKLVNGLYLTRFQNRFGAIKFEPKDDLIILKTLAQWGQESSEVIKLKGLKSQGIGPHQFAWAPVKAQVLVLTKDSNLEVYDYKKNETISKLPIPSGLKPVFLKVHPKLPLALLILGNDKGSFAQAISYHFDKKLWASAKEFSPSPTPSPSPSP